MFIRPDVDDLRRNEPKVGTEVRGTCSWPTTILRLGTTLPLVHPTGIDWGGVATAASSLDESIDKVGDDSGSEEAPKEEEYG